MNILFAVTAIVVSVIVIPFNSVHGTVLGDLATSMPARSWVELPTNTSTMYNVLYQQSGTGAGGSILEYTHKGTWDNVGRRVYFEGASHERGWKFLQYDDATNAWTVSSHGCFPPPCADPTAYKGHAYSHNTISSSRREFFHKWEQGSKISKYNIANSTWSLLPIPYTQSGGTGGDYSFNYTSCQEYMHVSNKLVLIDGTAGLMVFDPPSNTWLNRIGTTPITAFGNENVSAYSSKHQTMICAGGYSPVDPFPLSGTIFRYTDAGTLTQMPTMPFVGKSNNFILTTDPVSGDFLALSSVGTNKFYSYNPTGTGTWTSLGATGVPVFSYGPPGDTDDELYETIAIPIDTYGVVMFISMNYGSPHVWLYKHTSSVIDTSPPTTPTNLVATGVSSSRIDLTWTASTDNVGVSGYYIYRSNTSTGTYVNIGSSGTTTYQDTASLSPSTTYWYKVAAYDASGNVSQQSAYDDGTTIAVTNRIYIERTGTNYSTIAAAVAAAQDNDVIGVNAGVYQNQTSTINKTLTIRGIGGRAHFQNVSTYISRGIFVVSNGNPPVSNITVTFENLEISGSGNGGGEFDAQAIMVDFQNVVIDNCYIHNNNGGVMTSADKTDPVSTNTTVTIRNSIFEYNGDGSGYTHSMYIGNIGTLILQGNYIHHTPNVGLTDGHLVKSRAKRNFIYYNRIMDEATGASAYVIDIPMGGETYIIGNLLHKGPNSVNINVINYSEEGGWAGFNAIQKLYVVNNTIVNERTGYTPVRIVEQTYNPSGQSTTLIQNNIVVSAPAYTLFYGLGVLTNITNLLTNVNPGFTNMPAYNYALESSAIGAINLGTIPSISPTGVNMTPSLVYLHPASTSTRIQSGSTIDIGAYEYGSPIDSQPPIINATANTPSGTYPSSTTSLLVEWGTNENSTCKYDTRPNISYLNMLLQDGPMSLTGSILHNRTKTGMTPGSTYTYYVRCIDASGNANQTDYAITWSIQGIYPTPPVVRGVLTGGASFTGGQIQ